MIASLPLFHRIDGQSVIVLGEGTAAQAKRRLVERAGGVVATDENAPDARLAFVALDEPEAAVARLRARGLLVNVADRPDLCDFTLPSILDRDPVLIAIGTGGASAGLAKALRLRLERLLPAGLGALATGLFEARGQIRRRWPDADARRRALDDALEEGGALDPMREPREGAMADWLSGVTVTPPPVTHEILLKGREPDDLTVRESRWLGSADVIVHAPDVPARILDRARADAARFTLTDRAGPPPAASLVVIIRN